MNSPDNDLGTLDEGKFDAFVEALQSLNPLEHLNMGRKCVLG